MRKAILTNREELTSNSVENMVEGSVFRLLGGLLVFFGAVEILTIGVSLCQLTITRWLALGIIIFSGLLGWCYGYFLKNRRPGIVPRKTTTRRGMRCYLIFSLVMIWYSLLWIMAYILPDSSWDGLWYHNPTMHSWALKGYVHWIAADFSAYWTPIINSYWNGYPKAVELFGFILIRATGLPRLLNAINLPWIPLGVLGVSCLARAAGTTTRWAILTGSLFLLIPLNISQSPTTYVDTATAACFAAFLAILVVAISRIRKGEYSWKIMPALGCAAGLALGAKGTGFILFIIGLTAIMLQLIIQFFYPAPVKRSFRRFPGGYTPGRLLRRSIVFLAMTIVAAMIVGGYWYLRNYLRTGSPFYPVGLFIAGHQIFPGISDPGTLIIPPFAAGTEEWPQLKRILFTWGSGWNMENWKRAVISYTSRQGGLGFFWVLGCLPAILYYYISAAVRWTRGDKQTDPALKILLPLLFIVMILFVFTPRNHIARFSIWLYGLGLPCFAVMAGRVWKSKASLTRRGGHAWVTACIILAVFEGLYSFCHQRGLRLYEHQEEGGEGGFSLSGAINGLSERYPVGYLWPRLRGSRFEEVLDGADPVALSRVTEDTGKNRILGHLTQQQAFGERPIYFFDRKTVAADSDRIRDFIESRNIRYIIWDTDEPIPRELARQVDEWYRVNGRFYLLEFNQDDHYE